MKGVFRWRPQRWGRWALWLTAVALVLVGGIAAGVTCIERRQAAELRDRVPYAATPGSSGPAVIYFSRSGSTALVARHLANRLDASLYELNAPDYELGIPGWVRALLDARSHDANLAPNDIDLSAHDPIYLGSPIWLYSPAPPIWAFMRANRFDGKRVVLFNTLNSTFDAAYIDAFGAAVLARGARTFEHRYVIRGRMTQQLSPEAMLKQIDAEWGLTPSSSDDPNGPN